MEVNNQSFESPKQSDPRMKKVVPWIIYVIFFSVINETVFNVSTPSIAEQFNLEPSEVSWVVTICILMFGIGTVIYSKLADIYSMRKLMILGILTYVGGSAIGFIFQSWYLAVIFGRAVQGAGGAAIPALVMILVAKHFSQEERGKLFGIITSIVSLAVGIGPVIGGFVSAHFHWSFLFFISLFTLVSIPAFNKLLPKESEGNGKMDIPGGILLAIGVSTLIVFFTEMNIWFLVVSVVFLIWFVFHIRRVDSPFVEPSLFKNNVYRSGLLIGFLVFCTVFGILFIIPLMLNKIYGLSTDTIGLVMFPGAISGVFFGTLAGNLTVKQGSHKVVYLGLGLISVSLLLVSVLIGQWVWLLATSLILMYIGFSFLQTALAESITQILPPQEIGVGMGFYNLTSCLAGSIGTAIIAKIVEVLIKNPVPSKYALLIGAIAIFVICTIFYYFFTLGKNKQTAPAHS